MHPVPFRRDESIPPFKEKVLTAENTRRNKSKGFMSATREIVWELLFVKNDPDDYIRPWLRTPGTVLEGFLLACILASLAVSIMDSMSSWEPQSPESRCWAICCDPKHGRCKPDTCEAHKNDTIVDPACSFAMSWVHVRDYSLHILMAIFTVEYAGRLWTCVENPQFARPFRGRIAWMRLPLSLVDLFSVLPFYIDAIFSTDDDNGPNSSYVLRAVRLLRIMTVLRLERPLKAIHVMVSVCGRKSEELLVTLFGACVLILLFGSIMYILEFDENPEMFPNIPAAMWWCVNCLSTVGYGDAVPITPAGQLLGALAAFLGVGLFAMPAGILGSGFLEVYEERKSTLHVSHKADSMWAEHAKIKKRRKKLSRAEKEKEKAREKERQRVEGGSGQRVSYSSDDTPGDHAGGGSGLNSAELVPVPGHGTDSAGHVTGSSGHVTGSSPLGESRAASSSHHQLQPRLERSASNRSVFSVCSEESWMSDGGAIHQTLSDMNLRVGAVEGSIQELHTMMERQEALLQRLLEAHSAPAAGGRVEAAARNATSVSFV